MSLNLNDFQQADYADAPLAPPSPLESDSSLFPRALLFGVAGAVAGAIVYAAFIEITGIQIGYLAIGVAYLVAKAITIGSRERGGRQYQIAAVVLTCLAVGIGNAMMFYWEIHKEQPVPLSAYNILQLLRLGFERPFLRFSDSAFGGAIGLFILFIGLRAAWRMTSGLPGASQHPFQR